MPFSAGPGCSSAAVLNEATSRRAIEIIERNTRLQAQLIEDLLDISRIVTGKLRLELRAVSIGSIMDAAVEAVRPAADAKRIALVIDNQAVGDVLLCDPGRMQQVVWNLLSNAIKFTPERGRVELAARRIDEAIAITVTDTGAGIAPEFLPFVFDRFRQQDAATTRQHGGLGIGLSIVRHLVELHGGTATVESGGAGAGAAFRVTIPLGASPASAEGAIDRYAEAVPSLDGVRVLVVDGDSDAGALVATTLAAYGATVDVADSTATAVESIARTPPDVILNDVAGAGEDGFAFIRHVRSLDGEAASIPAAAVTASAGGGERARLLRAGYQAHLPKPVEPSDLVQVVAALAGRIEP